MICRDATEAISRSFDTPLSRLKRIDLAIHTTLCLSCRRFQTQMVELHKNFETLKEDAVPDNLHQLTIDARERILAELDSQPGNDK